MSYSEKIRDFLADYGYAGTLAPTLIYGVKTGIDVIRPDFGDPVIDGLITLVGAVVTCALYKYHV